MTSRPLDFNTGIARSRNCGCDSRSGETSNTSISSRSSRSNTSSQSCRFDEFTVAASMPMLRAASTWSRINASSGEITMVGPAPTSRRASVAAQYTADLPQPVACTTSTRCAPDNSAATAST